MHYLIGHIVNASTRAKLMGLAILASYIAIGVYNWNIYRPSDWYLDLLKF